MNPTVKTAYCRHKNFLWPVILIGLFFSACGYRFSGSGNLPGGVQTVAVKVFENRTSETGLEHTITNDLIFEFTRNGRSVSKSSEKSDAVLTGVIASERIITISRRQQQSPLERRVYLTFDLKLTRADDRVIWSVANFSDFEAYNVGSDKSVTDSNKRRAIETLSKRFAEKMYNRLTEDF